MKIRVKAKRGNNNLEIKIREETSSLMKARKWDRLDFGGYGPVRDAGGPKHEFLKHCEQLFWTF